MLHAPSLDRVPTGRLFITVEAPPNKRLKLPGGDRSNRLLKKGVSPGASVSYLGAT